MTFLILVIAAHAANEPAGNLVKPFPAQVMRNEVVEFKPVKDHHFSMEAPQKCQEARPFEHTPRSIKCQFTAAGASSAQLNVCDDKKTFCKPVTLALNVAAGASGEPVRLLKNQHSNGELKKVLVPGFTMGPPAEIIAQAKKRKQPVLVMISTDWCPPCNEAKEYLLNSEPVMAATKDWFKVYVDGDSLDSVAWEKHVPYKYYPSFVLLNSRMEEIARFNGELRQSDFIAWAKEQARRLEDPIEALTARVLARKNGSFKQRIKDFVSGESPAEKQADDVRLLRWALDQKKHEIIAQITPGGKFPELAQELGAYRVSRIEEDENPDKAKKLELMKAVVDAAYNGEDWAAWVATLCDEDETLCREQIQRVEGREKILNARQGLTKAEMASMLAEEYLYVADVFEKLKDKNKMKMYAAKCVSNYESLKSLSHLKLGRSAQQNLMPCLEMSGQFDKAHVLLKQLIMEYPNEPTFLLRAARLFRKQKYLIGALGWVDKAIEKAYGFNWFSAQLIKVDILLDLKRVKEAEKVIAETLEEARVSEDKNNRNQTVVARLRAAQTKIQSSSSNQ